MAKPLTLLDSGYANFLRQTAKNASGMTLPGFSATCYSRVSRVRIFPEPAEPPGLWQALIAKFSLKHILTGRGYFS
jgi:hypothetical protein